MVTQRSSGPKDAAAAAILRHREQDLALMPGKYLFGRDRKCNLVIDREVVSRQHAYLQVLFDSSVHIKDLGSHNGTYVNGQIIGDALVSLHPTDWFVLGSEMFEVDPENDSPHSDTTRVVTVLSDRKHVVLVDSRGVALDDTQAAHDIDLVCAMAEKTMAANQCAEVESLLATPLRRILFDTLSSRTVSRRVRAKAIQCAVKLADATRNAEWFNYAFDLLIAESIMCTEEQAEQLLQLHKRIGQVDPKRLWRYLELLRRKAPTIENLRVVALLESMRGAPVGKR